MFKRLKSKSAKTKDDDLKQAPANIPNGKRLVATSSTVQQSSNAKLKRDANNKSNTSTNVSINTHEEHRNSIPVKVRTFKETEKEALENTVIYPNSLFPYGDGADKLFGIENYGYICYMSSIFQCLYHTPEFRKAILTLEGGGDSRRKIKPRKFTVPGKKVNKCTKSVSYHNNNATANGNKQPGSPLLQSVSSTTSLASNTSKKLSIFSRSNDSNQTDISSTTNEESHCYKQTDFGISDTYNDKELAARYLNEFPALKNIECNYFLNTQRNLTLVGLLNDPSATLEWRKKAALINGPIINLDSTMAMEYGFENDNMLTVLKAAFECITENYSKTGVLSPYHLVEVTKRENVMFRNMQHQDAHEFVNFLINNVIESANMFGRGNVLTDIFEGELTSETKCLTCDSSSYRNEKFLDLSVDLEQDSSITNCLRLFSKIEMLNGNNKFYCENCYSYQEAAKMIKLKKLPKILTFHLKRFKYSESLDRMVKLFYRVEYVKTLRIANTTKDSEQQDKLYELYAVVLHTGGGPYHGHYVSLVKTELYGWLLFDDETIEKISEDYVYSFFGDGVGLCTAYLLFYQEVKDEMKFYQDKLASMLGNSPVSVSTLLPEVAPSSAGISRADITAPSVSSVDLTDEGALKRASSIFGFIKK